jgi:hypothetical protein
MPPKKPTVSVNKRLLSKNLAQRLEESDDTEPVVEAPVIKEESIGVTTTNPVREEIPKPPRSVMIVDKPREAMIGQGIPVTLGDQSSKIDLMRIGVDRTGGSLFHCIVRSTYLPYLEWNREKRIRKVREFRQDLAANFDGFYLRLDQKHGSWPPLAICKRELESSDGAIQYDYLDYVGKIINKSIVILTTDQQGVVKPMSGTKVYARSSGTQAVNNHTKTNSPITYIRSEQVYIFILHLGGPAYELLGVRKEGQLFTLFPESHIVTKFLTKDLP